ncbi:G-protein coupled receptor Mth2 isoform X2 [Fopius arisanus]|uniref:G-protein coupled receptor Mth2 isoform X2 n=1 Tax=Fopius arisanus TaxID=64838 RepID=A0A9R1U3P9_9HYME|nr:PREDICTED: G-protein coupled receptor Mth2-like isoform X2 [Fopius arisanus]
MSVERIFLVIVWITRFGGNYVECNSIQRIPRDDPNTENTFRYPRANQSSVAKKSDDLHLPICCPPEKFTVASRYVICESSSFYDFDGPVRLREDIPPAEEVSNNYHQVVGSSCEIGPFYELSDEVPRVDRFLMLDDGRLFVVDPYSPVPSGFVRVDHYCMSSFLGKNGTYTRIIACIQQKSIKEHQSYAIIVALPVPFLIVTFLVYACLPELRNVHGMILMAYVASVLWAYGAVTFERWKSITLPDNLELCKFLGITMYISLLSSFFWLNVMCFDIWWTFRQLRPPRRNVKQNKWKIFIIYGIYAWGYPSIILILISTVGYVPKNEDDIRPRFADVACWFKNRTAESICFYYPVVITVICNILLFALTIRKIYKDKKSIAALLKSSDSRRHNHHEQRLNIYLKLFVVMGINWSMDIIAWLLKNQAQWIWHAADLLNSFQGIMIFVIFVWKDRIKRRLIKRFECLSPYTLNN